MATVEIIRGQLEEADYVAAQRLYRRPSRFWQVFGVVFAVVMVAGAVVAAKAGDKWVFYFFLMVLAGSAIGGLAGHYLWLPWQARRVFRQQKSLQRPFEISWDDKGIYARDDHGEYKHFWADFMRWNEDSRLFVLSLSEVMFLMVPKRAFSDERLLNLFREQVRARVTRP